MSDSGGPNLDSTDPFSHLHKMSITAGLGSGDYVAINGFSVAAILLGIGSALVLFNNLIFLILPVLGIICGIWAWKQIGRSNGTQTGKEIAIIGLLLSIGFGGFLTTRTIYAAYENHSDEQQIVGMVRHLGDLIKQDNYQDAYNLFDERFKHDFSEGEFEATFRKIKSSPIVGNMQYFDWNHLLSFDVDPVDNSRMSSGMMLMKFNPPQPYRINMGFRQIDGKWYIDQVPDMFSKAAENPASKKPQKMGSVLMGPPKPV